MQQSTRPTYVVALKIVVVALLAYTVVSTILAAKKRDWFLLAISAAGILILTGSALAMFLPEH